MNILFFLKAFTAKEINLKHLMKESEEEEEVPLLKKDVTESNLVRMGSFGYEKNKRK